MAGQTFIVLARRADWQSLLLSNPAKMFFHRLQEFFIDHRTIAKSAQIGRDN